MTNDDRVFRLCRHSTEARGYWAHSIAVRPLQLQEVKLSFLLLVDDIQNPRP